MNALIRSSVLLMFLGLCWPVSAAINVGIAGPTFVLAASDTEGGGQEEDEEDCD